MVKNETLFSKNNQDIPLYYRASNSINSSSDFISTKQLNTIFKNISNKDKSAYKDKLTLVSKYAYCNYIKYCNKEDHSKIYFQYTATVINKIETLYEKYKNLLPESFKCSDDISNSCDDFIKNKSKNEILKNICNNPEYKNQQDINNICCEYNKICDSSNNTENINYLKNPLENNIKKTKKIDTLKTVYSNLFPLTYTLGDNNDSYFNGYNNRKNVCNNKTLANKYPNLVPEKNNSIVDSSYHISLKSKNAILKNLYNIHKNDSSLKNNIKKIICDYENLCPKIKNTGRWVYHDDIRKAKYKLYIGQYNRLLLMPESSTVDTKRDLWVWHRDHDTTSSSTNFGPPDVLDDGGLITMELQAKPLAFALTSRGGNSYTLSRPQQEAVMLVTSNLYDPSYSKTVDCNAAEKDACFALISRIDSSGTRSTAVVFEWEEEA